MPTCPSCDGEIAAGASICRHCKTQLGVPKRPTGVTVIAVLCFIGVGMNLLSLASLNPYTSIILGIRVPVPVTVVVSLISVALSIYCGYGFLKLKEIARKIYIWVAAYSVANGLISMLVVLSSLSLSAGMMVSVAIGTIIGLAIPGYVLYYLIRRKDYFVN